MAVVDTFSPVLWLATPDIEVVTGKLVLRDAGIELPAAVPPRHGNRCDDHNFVEVTNPLIGTRQFRFRRKIGPDRD